MGVLFVFLFLNSLQLHKWTKLSLFWTAGGANKEQKSWQEETSDRPSADMPAAHFVLTFLLLAVSLNIHPPVPPPSHLSLLFLLNCEEVSDCRFKFEPDDHRFFPTKAVSCEPVQMCNSVPRCGAKPEPNAPESGIWRPQLHFPSAPEVVERPECEL